MPRKSKETAKKSIQKLIDNLTILTNGTNVHVVKPRQVKDDPDRYVLHLRVGPIIVFGVRYKVSAGSLLFRMLRCVYPDIVAP